MGAEDTVGNGAASEECGSALNQRPHSPPARRRLALLPLWLATLACECAGPASEARPPAQQLELLETFAARVRAEGLAAAWERRRPLPFGLAPLLVQSSADSARLRAALPQAANQRRLRALEDVTWRLQLAADEDLGRTLRAIEAVRARHGLGDQVPLERTLTENPDARERQAAWMAQAAAAHELAPLLREAARRRNAWAVRSGNGSFLAQVERHGGVLPATRASLRAVVLDALRPAADEALTDPWDLEATDPALITRLALRLDAAGCERRARGALALAGLPPTPVGLTLDTRGDPQGFADFASFAVDPPRDIRVRIASEAGLFAHWAALHELGHAAAALRAPEGALPLLARPLGDAVSEGCAKVFERLAFAPEWLRAQGVPEADISALAAWEQHSERARMRTILADTAFEDVLQADPDGDLDTAHARILREVAGLRAVPGLPAWALHRTVAAEPRGRFDYLLARCAQAAITRRLRSLPGGLLGTEARQVLQDDVLGSAPGASYEEWFEAATGEPPACTAWLEDVAGLSTGSGH